MNDGKSFFCSYFFLSFIRVFPSQELKEADSNIFNFFSFSSTAILVNMEAKKESARHVQPDTFKTPKESRHAKNVQSTHISLKKASLRKRIVKNVPSKNQLDSTREPQMKHPVFVKGLSFIPTLSKTVFPVRQVLIVPPKMDSHLPSSQQNLDTGDQVLTVKFFHHVLLDTVRWRLRTWPMHDVAQLIPVPTFQFVHDTS